MTVGELGRRMSMRELREWQEEFKLRNEEERDRHLEHRAQSLARGGR